MALTFLLDTSVVKRLGRPAVRKVIAPLAAAAEELDIGVLLRRRL